MNQKQIEAVDKIKEESNLLLYYGEEATGTVMESYYRIIEDDDELKINEEVAIFKEFVQKSNEEHQKYLRRKQNG